ncbi:MAG TPA: SDR family oxidoreductase [Kribbella sp.]|uniref:SDR family oxidoreductase n=1 Tax=Kribbella sp. TaxID=1871183 RepID=UPI002D78061B|nr:SDR family oxidoreductase [Kribbella sp.]HET6296368.1 SDR family oxidoreductase [Kribbella sp.]
MSPQGGNRLQRVEVLAEVPDLSGRVALVTGASDGVGRSVARQLAEAGAVTLIAARDLAKGARVRDEIRNATGKDTVVVELDLADLASVRKAAATVLERWDRLDLLACVAGISGHGARTETADGFEMTFGVNHLGPALLARLLEDRLRASAPSRILFVASEAHRRAKGGLDFDDLMMTKGRFRSNLAYNRSKLANILYAREYARRLEGSGVDVVAAHPGAVDTPMVRALFDHPVVRDLYPLLRRGLISPDDAAAGLLRVALAPPPASDRYYERGRPVTLGSTARDDGAGRRLWSVTEELTGLSARHQ